MPTSSSFVRPRKQSTSGNPANQEKFKARETQSNDKSGSTRQTWFEHSSQLDHPSICYLNIQQPNSPTLSLLVSSHLFVYQINFHHRIHLQSNPLTITKFVYSHQPTSQTTSAKMPFTASDICKIILAVILPPLGVFLERGCGGDFLINILLTVLGYFPGIIHALYIILKY
ncbi:hypothetical protein EV127DRAFT_449510 [Xylaria flabelliformis]|nr:hypothetical protein EV127DRAFT_449510 [Xylaria flabelliformis]